MRGLNVNALWASKSGLWIDEIIGRIVEHERERQLKASRSPLTTTLECQRFWIVVPIERWEALIIWLQREGVLGDEPGHRPGQIDVHTFPKWPGVSIRFGLESQVRRFDHESMYTPVQGFIPERGSGKVKR